GVGTGEYEISVRALGYKGAQETVVIEEVGDMVELDFVLEEEEETSLSGEVTDQTTGEGLEDVTVTMTSAESDFELSTETDKAGVYQFTDQISGEFEVIFEKEGYNSITEIVHLESGEHKELQVVMSEF